MALLPGLVWFYRAQGSVLSLEKQLQMPKRLAYSVSLLAGEGQYGLRRLAPRSLGRLSY